MQVYVYLAHLCEIYAFCGVFIIRESNIFIIIRIMKTKSDKADFIFWYISIANKFDKFFFEILLFYMEYVIIYLISNYAKRRMI